MRARIYSPVGEVQIDHEFTDEVVVGRGKGSSLQLAPELLSKRHARIFWHSGSACYLVEDLGSTNGTALDGEKVRRPVPLGHMHVITLAERFDLVFQDLERCSQRSPSPALSTPPGRDAASSPSDKTTVVPLPVPLPAFLRDGADEKEVTEGTLMQRLHIPLPGFLRRDPEERTGVDVAPALPEALRQPPPPQPPSVDPIGLGSTLDIGEAKKAGTTADDTRQAAVAAGRAVQSGIAEQAAMAEEAVRLLTDDDPVADDGSSPFTPHGVFSLRMRVDDQVRDILLEPGENVVGRSAECQVHIKKPEVSRRHAVLLVENSRLRIRDLGSHNKTFVNDRAIEWEIDLEAGQEVRFGSIPATVRFTPSESASQSPRRRQ